MIISEEMMFYSETYSTMQSEKCSAAYRDQAEK